jgi:hypothetical protein
MNSITFDDKSTFASAVGALALESLQPYTVEGDTLTISSNDVHSIIDVLIENGLDGFTASFDSNEPWDGFRNDVEADADALASAGFGTDEDYGGSNDGGWDE